VNQNIVLSILVADEVIDTIAVDISVLGVLGVAPCAGVKFPRSGFELTVSKGSSHEMFITFVAHHICGFWVFGIIFENGISGDSTLAEFFTEKKLFSIRSAS